MSWPPAGTRGGAISTRSISCRCWPCSAQCRPAGTLALLRGDHQLNEQKLIDATGAIKIRPAEAGPLEPLIEELSQLVDISPRDIRRFQRLREDDRRQDAIPIRTQLTDAEVARFTAQRFRFPGVDVSARLFRHYPLGATGSHLLGYIGRINQAEKQMIEDWPEEAQSNYKGTRVIGKLGLEQRYEDELHGTTGFEQYEQTAGGRAVRRLRFEPATIKTLEQPERDGDGRIRWPKSRRESIGCLALHDSESGCGHPGGNGERLGRSIEQWCFCSLYAAGAGHGTDQPFAKANRRDRPDNASRQRVVQRLQQVAAVAVREGLARAGFSVRKVGGYGRKREMIVPEREAAPPATIAASQRSQDGSSAITLAATTIPAARASGAAMMSSA